MGDATLRITVGLQLGTAVCMCQCCGAEVTDLDTNDLNCKSSGGRYYHHVAINKIIHHNF